MSRPALLPHLFLLSLALGLVAPRVQGATEVTTPHATVTLLSSQPQAVPGETLWLGLRFELIPHWHVYWRNPGASGSAPVIRWQLPAGWQPGDIRWPVPQRLRVGPLTNYGYEGQVTLLVPVQVPPDAATGATRISADVEWLVCREECIPESGRFTLDLAGETTAAAASADAFREARSRWPAEHPLPGHVRTEDQILLLDVDVPDLAALDPADIWFAAYAWGPVDASGPQEWRLDGTRLSLRVATGDLPPGGQGVLEGLLVVETPEAAGVSRHGYPLRLITGPPAADTDAPGLPLALGLALLGGLVLNLMPCVLPVLGIKVMGLVREAGAQRRRLGLHGLVYAAGVMGSFVLLAIALLALRAGGESLGWGFQLQSPVVVTLLAYLMLLVGLNLSGVFSIGDRLMGAGQSLTGGGLWGTLGSGVLAVVVASPCTAPFMGTALGFAITRPAGEALAVFLALGAGFALPVLLLSLLPAWVRLIPKPGPWMRRLQQWLAFPMYATVAWLLWVLSQQAGAPAYGGALAGLVLLAMAAWIYGQWQPRGWRLGLLGVGLAGVLALSVAPLARTDSATPASPAAAARPWSEQEVHRLTAQGHPVFVNFTAAWCITCKVNERVALATENTRRLFAAHAVVPLVADWTRRDPAITRQLERYGRSGVPLYLLYPPGGEPRILPQLLTEGIVAAAVENL